jgi:hypothetical protein
MIKKRPNFGETTQTEQRGPQQDPRALPRVALAAPWDDNKAVHELYELLRFWAKLEASQVHACAHAHTHAHTLLPFLCRIVARFCGAAKNGAPVWPASLTHSLTHQHSLTSRYDVV